MVFEEFNNQNELNKSRMGVDMSNPLSLIQGNFYTKRTRKIKGEPTFGENFPGVIIEGMTVKRKLDDINRKEKQWIKNNEGKVTSAMGKYETEYESMMREHLLLSQAIPECKGQCMTTYPGDISSSDKKRKACIAGCDLKGPYILQCKDTYKGKASSPDKKCEQLTAGKCDTGTIILGNEEFIKRDANKDANGLTLQDGCCECGGGGGGKPTTKIGGNLIKSCDDPELKTALGGFDGKPQCTAAPYPQANAAHKLHKKYDKVLVKNKALESEALRIWNNIVKLEDIDKKVKKNTVDEEEAIARNTSRFRDLHEKIQKQGIAGVDGGNATIDAQLEEGQLLTPTEKFKIFGWSILGVSLLLVIFAQLRKEVK